MLERRKANGGSVSKRFSLGETFPTKKKKKRKETARPRDYFFFLILVALVYLFVLTCSKKKVSPRGSKQSNSVCIEKA